MLVMIDGDIELNVAGVRVMQDVRSNDFFKLKIRTKAPEQSRHYKAAYQLMDNSGNSFGEKVDLDIIVEDDCSESVILAEMM